MNMTNATTPKILVVDDDPAIRHLLHRYLGRKYHIQCAVDGKTALETFEKFNPDLVILDWNLPDNNGYNLCQEMQRYLNVLVLILTSRKDEADKIRVLKAGADDFMTKPFSLAEVEVRVEVLLRRVRHTSPTPTQRLVFNQLVIDPVRRAVILNEQLVDLTPIEFDILHFLATHPNQVWGRRDLIKEVWECDYVGEQRVVDVHIGQIRKKIEIDGTQPKLIQTVRGFGYIFEPPSTTRQKTNPSCESAFGQNAVHYLSAS